jgi:diaminopimelate decarboxylase
MAGVVGALIEQNFGASGGELVIDGVPITQLAARHGTPAFFYSRRIVEQQIRRLRRAVPEGFHICYSIKANPSRALLEIFLSRDCGLEIASAGEFHQALAANANPADIIFAGPGKTEAELELVLKAGIGEIHAESEREIRRIGAIAGRLGSRARVAVRVNPGAEAQGGAMRMGGKPLPFGVDEERLDEVLGLLLEQPAIEFRGIHLFAGTQILEAEVLVGQYRTALDIARRAAEITGHPVKTVDFGGGLGIPYFENDRALDLEAFRTGLSGLMAEYAADPRLAGTRFIVEPGRFLVGEAGVYVVRISDIKISRGKKFLIVDGGMHHHLAASGNLGQTIKRNYPVALANRLDAAVDDPVDVAGPLCTPLDVLARGVRLPRAEVGDLLVIFQSGAYARAASPLNFLSHPTPPEILVDAGRDALVRARGDAADYALDPGLSPLRGG